VLPLWTLLEKVPNCESVARQIVGNRGRGSSYRAIVAAELYAGVSGDEELNILDKLLHLSELFLYPPIWRAQPGSTRKTTPSLTAFGLADAIIAATAEAENAELNTLNTKHYPMIKGEAGPTQRHREAPSCVPGRCMRTVTAG